MVFLLWVRVGAQRCAATLAVAETGGCKAQGQTGGGGSPGLHKRIDVVTEVQTRIRAEGWGYRPAALVPRQGAAPPSNRPGMVGIQGKILNFMLKVLIEVEYPSLYTHVL